MADPSHPSSPSDLSGSVADPPVADPNIIPSPESASSPADRPVSTILADSPTEPKTPLADPRLDYTIPPTVPDESTVATESASVVFSPIDISADSGNQPPVDLQTTVPAELPVATQSATIPTEVQREATPPPPPPVPEEIQAAPPQPEPQLTPTPPPESVEGGSIQDSLPSDKPSQVQPEVPVNAPSPEASQTPEEPPQSAEIKPDPPQDTQNAPLADSQTPVSPKTSFGDLVSDQTKPVSSPVSPQLPRSPQVPISSPSTPNTSFGDLELAQPQSFPQSPPSPQSPISPLSPQKPTETVIEAKANFSSKRQQALQARRKKRDDHLAKILALVSQKGKIHNSDVRVILRVSQSTATNYLHSLVNDGKIQREGKAKATIYSL